MSWVGLVLLVAWMVCGCATLFDSTVTVKEISYAAMRNWGDLVVAGKTTPELDAKVNRAWAEYQKAAKVMEVALTEYKTGIGTQANYLTAFKTTRAAALALLDILWPADSADMAELKAKLLTATK
jgi:hypothetical protein